MSVVLAVASSGGHWAQLMLLREALAGHDVAYATTLPGLADMDGLTASIIPDCNRHAGIRILHSVRRINQLIVRTDPDVVITTGALPGLIAVVLARVRGKRAIWVESIANSEELSMSGKVARRLANTCFVQWPDLAARTGTVYAGAVL